MDLSEPRQRFEDAVVHSGNGDVPYVPEVTRYDAALFTKTLLRCLNCCTKTDMKLIKAFIVKNVTINIRRTSEFGTYLKTLSEACIPRDSETRVDTTKALDEYEGLGKIVNGKVQQPPNPAFRRIHIIYVLHDVLCYDAHVQETHGSALLNASVRVLRDSMSHLCQLAAADDNKDAFDIVNNLLPIWERLGIYSTNECDELHDAVKSSRSLTLGQVAEKLHQDASTNADEVRLNNDGMYLPTRHSLPGDPTAPWYDQPAANSLFLRRNNGSQLLRANITPQGGVRLRHGGQQPGDALKAEVEQLINDSRHCFDRYTSQNTDIDALGNAVPASGATRNYWGFNYAGALEKGENMGLLNYEHVMLREQQSLR